MKYMLLIYGNEEAFSSVGAETLAESRQRQRGAVPRGPLPPGKAKAAVRATPASPEQGRARRPTFAPSSRMPVP